MSYIALAMLFQIRIVLLLLVVSIVSGYAAADNAVDAYRAMGIEPGEVIAGTVLSAPVIPDAGKQVIAITTYFTGKREKTDAVNVRLAVLAREGDVLNPIYSRDLGRENGGDVGLGNLQIVDLDSDGVSEIIISYESYAEPLIERRLGEVIVHVGGAFETVWSGDFEYDATRAARNVPAERRDRFEREIDYQNTLRTRGVTLFFRKKVITVAGERLPQPKLVQETFPLRPVK